MLSHELVSYVDMIYRPLAYSCDSDSEVPMWYF